MRKSLYLLIALVCGTVATVIANQWLVASNGSQTAPTTEVFVASAAIDIGEEITPEKVRLESWPADKVPQGATEDFSILEGKYARQRFYADEVIMTVKLMDENWTTVPKGYSVVAMKASNVSISNLIQPGDRVDVLAFFEKSELIPQSMTKTVLMGVRVYALDGDTERRAGEDKPKRIQNIQLLINKKDQQAWAYAGELGRIQLALGSDADYTTEDGSNETAKEFLTWLEDYRSAQARAFEEDKANKNKRYANRSPKQPPSAPAREQNGFSMLKLVEGRMVEYWIVPGKLPVIIGEVGGADGSDNTDARRPANRNSSSDSDNGGEYSYLNGEESPLFQPPTSGRNTQKSTIRHNQY